MVTYETLDIALVVITHVSQTLYIATKLHSAIVRIVDTMKEARKRKPPTKR